MTCALTWRIHTYMPRYRIQPLPPFCPKSHLTLGNCGRLKMGAMFLTLFPLRGGGYNPLLEYGGMVWGWVLWPPWPIDYSRSDTGLLPGVDLNCPDSSHFLPCRTLALTALSHHLRTTTIVLERPQGAAPRLHGDRGTRWVQTSRRPHHVARHVGDVVLDTPHQSSQQVAQPILLETEGFPSKPWLIFWPTKIIQYNKMVVI